MIDSLPSNSLGSAMPTLRWILLTVGLCVLAPGLGFAQQTVEYGKQVKPILTRSCVECHNGKKAKGDLRLDSAAELLKGGKSGQVIVPGQADKSLLIQALH